MFMGICCEIAECMSWFVCTAVISQSQWKSTFYESTSTCSTPKLKFNYKNNHKDKICPT